MSSTSTRARVRALNAHLGTMRLAVSADWVRDDDGESYIVSLFDLDDGPDSMPVSECWGDTLSLAVRGALEGLDLGYRLDPGSVVPF
jgi:hypothetical protein